MHFDHLISSHPYNTTYLPTYIITTSPFLLSPLTHPCHRLLDLPPSSTISSHSHPNPNPKSQIPNPTEQTKKEKKRPADISSSNPKPLPSFLSLFLSFLPSSLSLSFFFPRSALPRSLAAKPTLWS